jgi:hypothetical protein
LFVPFYDNLRASYGTNWTALEMGQGLFNVNLPVLDVDVKWDHAAADRAIFISSILENLSQTSIEYKREVLSLFDGFNSPNTGSLLELTKKYINEGLSPDAATKKAQIARATIEELKELRKTLAKNREGILSGTYSIEYEKEIVRRILHDMLKAWPYYYYTGKYSLEDPISWYGRLFR